MDRASRASSNAFPHTNTYRVTAHGRQMATFLTKLATRVVVPGLTERAALVRPPKGNAAAGAGCVASLRVHLDALVRKRLAA